MALPFRELSHSDRSGLNDAFQEGYDNYKDARYLIGIVRHGRKGVQGRRLEQVGSGMYTLEAIAHVSGISAGKVHSIARDNYDETYGAYRFRVVEGDDGEVLIGAVRKATY